MVPAELKHQLKEALDTLFKPLAAEHDDPQREAGKSSAHGLRKVGATTAANNGAIVAELEAIFGWQGGRMAALYTQAADRARLAKAATAKLDAPQNEDATSVPSPRGKSSLT
jgi:hypothetical protein